MCGCVFVCERQSVSVCVCVRQRVCVCVCVCVPLCMGGLRLLQFKEESLPTILCIR